MRCFWQRLVLPTIIFPIEPVTDSPLSQSSYPGNVPNAMETTKNKGGRVIQCNNWNHIIREKNVYHGGETVASLVK